MPATYQTFQPLSLSQVNFSLTEGTDIPAPPPEEEARPATPAKGPLSSRPSTPTGQNGENGAVQAPEQTQQEAKPVRPRTSQDSPNSKKPSSIRKFLSFNKLRSHRGDHHGQNGSVRSPSALGSYGTGTAADVKLSNDSTFSSSRPGSPYTTDTATSPRSLTRKRSSGWFNSGNKRRSAMFVGRVDETGAPVRDVVSAGGPATAGAAATEEQRKPKGPPPPTLPEFRQFASLDGELERVHEMDGEDLFANIGKEQ